MNLNIFSGRRLAGRAKNQAQNIKTHEGLWLVFFVALAFASWLAGGLLWLLVRLVIDLSSMIFNKAIAQPSIWWALLLSMAAFVTVAIITIVKAWSQVPQQHQWLVELFGQWVKTWNAGLHFLFPYFNFTSFIEVYIGEQQMKLFLNEAIKVGFGFGDVEFKDGSAPVDATVYFRIADSAKSAYQIGNIFTAIEEKMDSAIRSFLGQYTIDQANVIKVRALLFDIMNGDYLPPEDVTDPDKSKERSREFSDWQAIEKKLGEECRLWKSILDDWGTKITAMAISDIVLPEDIKKDRQKVLTASKDAEASEHKRIELERLGAGMSAQVEFLVSKGVSPEDAVAYLEGRLKWENVGQKGATVIIDSGKGSMAGLGAQFAAGQKAVSTDSKSASASSDVDKTANKK